ncbi:MAG: hypothetical protein WD013_02375 [Gemmatimonadota bacterium]
MNRAAGEARCGRGGGGDPSAGFALPLAILALIAVGVVLTAGIQLTLKGPADPLDVERSTEAFYLAETGLNTVLADWSPPDSGLRIWGTSDTRRGETGQGRWVAEVQRVGEDLFFVRSTGIAGADTGGPVARRSIGTAARLEPVDLKLPRALETPGIVVRSETSEVRDGDLDPPIWRSELCRFPARESEAPTAHGSPTRISGEAGARVDRGTESPASRSHNGMEHTDDWRWYDLARHADIVLEPGGPFEVAAQMEENGCDYGAPLNWGSPTEPESPCGGYFPVIHVPGDLILAGEGAGQGLLLVDGDLRIEGAFEFYGLVAVRGGLWLEGTATSGSEIFGAVEAEDLEREGVRLSGATLIQYSRCALDRAILGNDRLRRIRPVSGRAWVDLASASL